MEAEDGTMKLEAARSPARDRVGAKVDRVTPCAMGGVRNAVRRSGVGRRPHAFNKRITRSAADPPPPFRFSAAVCEQRDPFAAPGELQEAQAGGRQGTDDAGFLLP